jgi:hypothetical protein
MDTLRGLEPFDRQEGRWPGREDLVFGWTLLDRNDPSRSVGESAFRLGEVLERTPVRVHQVHGDHLFIAERGVQPSLDNPAAADGILTSRRDLIIGVSVADCAPLFLCFPGGIGVLHAGWRGVLGGILPRALEYINSIWDVSPDDVEIVLGPSIASCCFEVSPAVAALFPPQLRRARGERIFVDMPGALVEQWIRYGGAPEHFFRCDRCTFCTSPRMHSYRRDGKGGRNFAFLYYLNS